MPTKASAPKKKGSMFIRNATGLVRGLAGFIMVDGPPAPEIFNGTPAPGSGH